MSSNRPSRKFPAKFPGECKGCGDRFDAGTPILWDSATRACTVVDCAGCNEDPGNRAEREMVEREIAAGEAKAKHEARPKVGEIAAIVALFDLASEHLKYPKVRLQLSDGTPVVLSRAGKRARFVGSINVTDGGRYGENRWFGRIHKDGRFQAGRDDLSAGSELSSLLVDFANDPAKVAAEHGRLNGRCCFCALALSDERSTAVGYGETCSHHYGLPWGSVVAVADGTVVDRPVGWKPGVKSHYGDAFEAARGIGTVEALVDGDDLRGVDVPF